MNDMPRDQAPNVIGGTELLEKHSAVHADGALRLEPIDGVRIRETRPVPHEDGHITEIARANWDILEDPVVQVHMTTTMPGRVRAWGLHQHSTDRLFVVSGLVRIVVFDGRENSRTFGWLNEVTLSEKNPALVTIASNLFHGWKNIGTTEAVIINMPTSLYNYDAPDALDMPWDSELAERLIPYRW